MCVCVFTFLDSISFCAVDKIATSSSLVRVVYVGHKVHPQAQPRPLVVSQISTIIPDTVFALSGSQSLRVCQDP